MLIVAGAALAFGTRPGAIADACGQTLRFVGTAEDGKAQSWSVPLFECRMHGSLYLTTEGLRREPPATRP